MAKQRVVNTHFWKDNYVVELDPTEKLIFLHLLTNEQTDICGIYELPVREISYDTGLEKEMVLKILSRFERDKKAYYYEGWICLPNFPKHQKSNPSVERGIERSLSQVPKEIMAYFSNNTQYDDSLSQTGYRLNQPNLTKPNLSVTPTSSEAGNKSRPWTTTLLDWLEERRGTKFASYEKQIGALGRLKKAGHSPKQIAEKMIALEQLSDWWQENPPDFVNLAGNVHKLTKPTKKYKKVKPK